MPSNGSVNDHDRPRTDRQSDHPLSLGGRTMSRRRLGRLVGVSSCHIGLVFSGKRQPSVDLINKIALVFDVTMDEVWRVININLESSTIINQVNQEESVDE